MSYNTVATFTANAFPSGSYAQNSDAEIQSQLDAAASEIDSALLVQHTLPLVVIPAAILEAERVIAGYRLYLFNGNNPRSVDDRLQQRYYEVMGDPNVPGSGMLYRIATGKMSFAVNVDSTLARDGAMVVIAGVSSKARGNFGVI